MRWIVLLMLLAGCASMRAATAPYKGQDVSVLVAKIGYPTEKREVLGHTVYRWITGVPNHGFFCNLDAELNGQNRVTYLNWQGNGCDILAAKL